MMENPRSRKLCIRNFLQQIHFLKLTLLHHCSSRFFSCTHSENCANIFLDVCQTFLCSLSQCFLQQKLLCKLLVSKYLSTEKRRESIHTESCNVSSRSTQTIIMVTFYAIIYDRERKSFRT